MPNNSGPGIDRPAASAGGLSDEKTIQRDAMAVVNEAQDVADEIKSEVTREAGHLADEAKGRLSEATEKARGLASEQKDFLAAQIGGVADAMDRVASDLEANDGASAHYARMIADNAEKLSSSIRDRSIDQLLHQAEDFGRQQPVAFIGAAALLGFVASRFLTASTNRPAPQEQPETAADSSLPATMADTHPTQLSGRP